MDLSDKTVEMLVELDEPEALLEAVRRAAGRRKGKRWLALTSVLDEASIQLDLILNAKPAGPDFTQPNPEPVNPDAEAKDRVSVYVNSRVIPTTMNLQKLAEALDTTPEALLADPLTPDSEAKAE